MTSEVCNRTGCATCGRCSWNWATFPSNTITAAWKMTDSPNLRHGSVDLTKTSFQNWPGTIVILRGVSFPRRQRTRRLLKNVLCQGSLLIKNRGGGTRLTWLRSMESIRPRPGFIEMPLWPELVNYYSCLRSWYRGAVDSSGSASSVL